MSLTAATGGVRWLHPNFKMPGPRLCNCTDLAGEGDSTRQIAGRLWIVPNRVVAFSPLRVSAHYLTDPMAKVIGQLKGKQYGVVWQIDSEVSACPKCRKPFTMIERKHHCRCAALPHWFSASDHVPVQFFVITSDQLRQRLCTASKASALHFFFCTKMCLIGMCCLDFVARFSARDAPNTKWNIQRPSQWNAVVWSVHSNTAE